MTTAYFERVGNEAFRPTDATGGGWDPDELHFGPLAGLLVHAIGRHTAVHGTAGLQLSRVGFDILGRLPRETYVIETAISRPGRTIELVTATAMVGGRAVSTARAWRLIAADTSDVADGAPSWMPEPDACAVWDLAGRWPGSFAANLAVRMHETDAGRVAAWVRSPLELVAGEPDPIASFMALVDVANGIASHRVAPEWFYPNVDLTVHLHRLPRPGWVGLDTSATFGASGLGITRTILHDEAGPVGTASQALTVRRR